jgi:hypothetical protein
MAEVTTEQSIHISPMAVPSPQRPGSSTAKRVLSPIAHAHF